jgi:hypothetical protein
MREVQAADPDWGVVFAGFTDFKHLPGLDRDLNAHTFRVLADAERWPKGRPCGGGLFGYAPPASGCRPMCRPGGMPS